MHIPKKYLHDKIVLLLVSTNLFLALICVAIVLLQAGLASGGEAYIVEYRSNLIDLYNRGSVYDILSFMLFALVIAAVNIVLSIRTYAIRRTLSLTILGLGALILLLTVIVSYVLLGLD